METRDFNLCKTSRDPKLGMYFFKPAKLQILKVFFFSKLTVSVKYKNSIEGSRKASLFLNSNFNDEKYFRLKPQDGYDGIQLYSVEWPLKSRRCIKIMSQLLLEQYDLQTNDTDNRRNRGNKSV